MAKPLGYQQITSLGSAVALTVPDHAVKAVVVCTGQTVRYRDDGTSPSATVGMLLTVGVTYEFNSGLSALKFIQTATTAVLNISYYGAYS